MVKRKLKSWTFFYITHENEFEIEHITIILNLDFLHDTKLWQLSCIQLISTKRNINMFRQSKHVLEMVEKKEKKVINTCSNYTKTLQL